MNLGIDYENDMERNNTGDSIVGVVSKEEIEISTTPKILSCSKVVRTGSGQNNVASNRLPQACVEAQNKTTT